MDKNEIQTVISASLMFLSIKYKPLHMKLCSIPFKNKHSGLDFHISDVLVHKPSNCISAFSHENQMNYLDFHDHSGQIPYMSKIDKAIFYPPNTKMNMT